MLSLAPAEDSQLGEQVGRVAGVKLPLPLISRGELVERCRKQAGSLLGGDQVTVPVPPREPESVQGGDDSLDVGVLPGRLDA
jgi:hypothetical protein